LECRTIGAHDGGTHTILVGEVTRAAVREEDDDPLLFYRSHYGTIVRSPESEKSFYESGDA
jgi:flavin reductase (DIM6/NTAB) family NADH-FMN oxidoreductase RutF